MHLFHWSFRNEECSWGLLPIFPDESPTAHAIRNLKLNGLVRLLTQKKTEAQNWTRLSCKCPMGNGVLLRQLKRNIKWTTMWICEKGCSKAHTNVQGIFTLLLNFDNSVCGSMNWQKIRPCIWMHVGLYVSLCYHIFVSAFIISS